MNKHIFILFFLIFLISGCSVHISTYSSVSKQSDILYVQDLKNDGLAMVPVGGSNPFYFDTISKTANKMLNKKLQGSYMSPAQTSQVLNEKNMVQLYRNTIDTYLETGISDQQKFMELGKALKVRYLLRMSLENVSNDKEIESYDEEVYTYKSRKSQLTAKIWDCSSGKLAWEGNGWSKAEERWLTYIDESKHAFVDEATKELINRIFKK